MRRLFGSPPPRVARLRALTPGQAQRLHGFRALARVLDSAIPVPGTPYRIGLDPILGLVPGLGDLVSPLFTIGIIWHAHELGVPRVVQLRMLLNVAIDTAFGLVPVAGDLFDFAWKANNRNMALLERHAYEEHRASSGDWLFVALMIGLLLAFAALPIVLGIWLLRALL
jgi:hypothetical protein